MLPSNARVVKTYIGNCWGIDFLIFGYTMNYTIKEILDIAIGIEVTGYELYIRFSEKFNDPAIKDIFSFLASEELVHKKLFESMEKDGAEQKGIFTEEYFLYLKAIGGGRVFEQKINLDQIMGSITTPMEAIKRAFNDEKQSILFYSEMKQLYPKKKEAIDLLNRIIEEERKHIAILVDLAEKIRITAT